MSIRRFAVGVGLLLGLLPMAVAGQGPVPLAGGRVGRVHFQTSCAPAAQRAFDGALALLHSFEFGPAIAGFRAALAADPGCAMAHWGEALSLWGNPFAPGAKPSAALLQGRAAIEAADAARPRTERESAYVAAAARLYERFESTSQQSRLDAYAEAMSKVAGRYPGDVEASIFYALSLAMSADPSDKTYARQLEAGAILEKLFRTHPRHPGLAHYLIHAYDSPPLAQRALPAARAYARIAPGSPHALHMPAHTFTRLGLWDESIRSNVAAAAAARREGNVTEELHASDYLVYAYLQSGRDAAADGLLRALPGIEARLDPTAIPIGAAPLSAAYFALAAIPARVALERGDWAAATTLRVRSTPYPFTDAIAWFARGLGAARLGEIAAARDAAQQLATLQEKLTQGSESYWARQVDIQRRDVLGWIGLAEGDSSGALTQLRAARVLEDGTEKSVITPGPIAPAGELLGEMLLQLGRPGDALPEFEATLAKEPNRFRSLYGAAIAAARSGDARAARRDAAALLRVCAHADRPGRAELERVRELASAAKPAGRADRRRGDSPEALSFRPR